MAKDTPPQEEPVARSITAEDDPRIDKVKVVMMNVITRPTDDIDEETGLPVFETHQRIATDYVRPDFLDAYVADAQTRWQYVKAYNGPDDVREAGPGGYHGQTYVPEGLDHHLAGRTFAATPESERD